MLVAIVAVLLMIAGFVFIFAAALGVMRFPDPLQRMHASTKAGTIGAVMVLLGTVLVHEQSGSAIIGLAAIGFLLITVPVAAHLLGRAVYVSGAELRGLLGKDALGGQIARSPESLEQRIDVASPDPAVPNPAAGATVSDPTPDPAHGATRPDDR